MNKVSYATEIKIYDDNALDVHHLFKEYIVDNNDMTEKQSLSLIASIQSKNEVKSTGISSKHSKPTPLSAMPRPEVFVELKSNSTESKLYIPQQPRKVNIFLADHPIVSALIVGFIGSDFGSILYGETIVGSKTAGLIGFLCRIFLIIVLAIIIIRFVCSKFDDDSFSSDIN
ncbi:MAG: hypothetical protein LBS66_04040 [Rhodospirillaceae bacterium]|nr:hypothetical protein [Rhodospirillaceae bacterium]